jgi:uncharacterized protein (TIGR00730 family)
MRSEPLIAVFGSSQAVPGDGLYELGVECGRLLADAGFGVVTGGYAGLMEAASRGAAESGGRVVGVTVPSAFPGRSGANPFVEDEVAAAHLVERIHHLTHLAAGSIVLPGSIGTMTELAMAWNLAYVARFGEGPPKPIVTVGPMWSELVAHLTDLLETDGDLVTCVDDVTSAVRTVVARVGV